MPSDRNDRTVPRAGAPPSLKETKEDIIFSAYEEARESIPSVPSSADSPSSKTEKKRKRKERSLNRIQGGGAAW